MMQVLEGMQQAGPYKLFYRSGGQGEPVILIHGIPTHSYLWHGVLPLLSESYHVITPDLLGYGNSEKAPTEELTLPRQAEHIIALLDSIGIEQAHFIGHDLGGGIVQILALQHPQRVLSFCVIDGVCFSNWPLPHVVSMRWPTAPEFEPSPNLVTDMLRIGTFNQQVLVRPLIEAFTQPYVTESGKIALERAASALDHIQTEELTPYLPHISVPVTLLWGQYDRFLPPYWGKKLGEIIPAAHFELLPGCGHYSMLDDPVLVADKFRAHLQKASPKVPELLDLSFPRV